MDQVVRTSGLGSNIVDHTYFAESSEVIIWEIPIDTISIAMKIKCFTLSYLIGNSRLWLTFHLLIVVWPSVYSLFFLIQGWALRRLPALQQHGVASCLPGDPHRAASSGAERRQWGRHGRLDAGALPVRLQRGEGEGIHTCTHAALWHRYTLHRENNESEHGQPCRFCHAIAMRGRKPY